MLATLNTNSVRAGKWHSLMDKVYSLANLFSAYREVAANKGAPGIDNVTIEDFTANLQRNIDKLEQQLREGSYRPQAIRRVNIPKPGTRETRPLGIPTVRDRVAQTRSAMCWSRFLNDNFTSTATAFAPIGAAKTRCAAWTVCSSADTSTRWTST
jgi:RNA-directed DNA polymerase